MNIVEMMAAVADASSDKLLFNKVPKIIKGVGGTDNAWLEKGYGFCSTACFGWRYNLLWRRFTMRYRWAF